MTKEKSRSQVLRKHAKRKKIGLFSKLIRWFAGLLFLAILAGVAMVVGIYFYLSQDLPKISSLKDYDPPIITTVYSDDNTKIAEFYRERRIILPLEKIPPRIGKYFLSLTTSNR